MNALVTAADVQWNASTDTGEITVRPVISVEGDLAAMLKFNSHDGKFGTCFLLSVEGCASLWDMLDRLRDFQPSREFILRAAINSILKRKSSALP